MSLVKNVGDLNDLVEQMKGFYSILHAEFKEDERWYSLDKTLDIGLPDDYDDEKVMLPTAKSIVDTAVDHVSPQFRDIKVPRKSATPGSTKRAQSQKKFYGASMTWLERQPSSSPYRAANKQLGTYGMSVTKTTYVKKWDVKKSEDKEGINDEYMPFSHTVLHPSEVMPDPWHDKPEWVIQVNSRMAGEMESVYPTYERPQGMKFTDRVEVVEFWDKGERAVLIDQEEIIKVGTKHKLGDHPYIVGDSGMGFIDEQRKPENRYMGFLRMLRGVLASESRNFSITDIVLIASGWPIRTATGEGASALAGKRMEYGKVYEIPEGTTLDTLKPELPPEMLQGHQFNTSAIISEASAPRPLAGLRNPGTTSGRDQNIQLGQARLRYQGMAAASEMMLTELARKLGLYMQNAVKHPVNISLGTTEEEFGEVSPRIFTGSRPVSVKVNVLEPDNEFAKKQSVAQEVQAGTIDQYDAIRELHPDKDPDEVLRRIRQDRLEKNPQVQQMLGTLGAQKILKDNELSELYEAFMARMEAVQTNTGQGRQVANNDGGTEDAQRRGEEGSEENGG